MQPMGRKKLRFPGKRDCHPGKGFINWWEDEVSPNKGSARQQSKIKKEQYYEEDLWPDRVEDFKLKSIANIV